MDPNTTLAELRALTATITDDSGSTEQRLANADRVAALFASLDDWITRGGFLPVAWCSAFKQENES